MSSGNYSLPVLFAGRDLDEPIAFSIRDGEIALFTHASPTLSHDNEDAVGVFDWKGETVVLVVADGLGGLPRGGDASHRMVESLSQPKIKESVDPVVACLESVNKSLVSGNSGSGTTVSVVTIERRAIRSYHVGDSATMVIGRRGRIKFQTTPHSPVGIAEASGEFDEETAMIHPNRHVINNIIGMPDMWIDIGKPVQLADLDTVILASDGLWDNLYRGEVAGLVGNRSLMECANGIFRMAIDRMKRKPGSDFGKPDDLSFIL
ncbi:uncharacterized protein METZ01_LOCUS346180, partial [marine metagenome]